MGIRFQSQLSNIEARLRRALSLTWLSLEAFKEFLVGRKVDSCLRGLFKIYFAIPVGILSYQTAK